MINKTLVNGEENDEALNRLRQKITPDVLEAVFESAQSEIAERNRREAKVARSGRVKRRTDIKSDTSLFRLKRSNPEVEAREKRHAAFEETTKKLIERFNLKSDEVIHLPRLRLRRQSQNEDREACEHEPGECDQNSKYRTASGRCNNVNHPTWGMSMACQQRMLPPSYDGESNFRVSAAPGGGPLPTPRQLSRTLHLHNDIPSSNVTHLYVFFGQLLDHDFALTPSSTTFDNEEIPCCPPTSNSHPQCAPIIVEGNDTFYKDFGVTCLNFVRTAICPTCAFGLRQQFSQLTSFVDGSNVYESSEPYASHLRANDETGRLRTQKTNFGDLLPRTDNPQDDMCSYPEENDFCFVAGDERVNENTILASLHTVFMREHNRVAVALKTLNQHWDEEQLYQEARRIVGAQMQNIVYHEYLPITLGVEQMTKFRLWRSERGTSVYNPHADPTMIIEFTTAAFRFMHTLINSLLSILPLNSRKGQRLLRNEFFQPFDLYNDVMGPLMRGASDSPAQTFDRHIVDDIANHLYRRRGTRFGMDLPAFNINRGRDNGLQPYVQLVRHCTGDSSIRSFNDLLKNNTMSRNSVNLLRGIYRHVEDIDLWSGIVMENPLPDGICGPTAACIIGLQFNRLKFGDRFYFEHRNQAGSFTHEQRMELRQATLTKILCRNSNVIQMPENAMRFASRLNPIVRCEDLRPLDLSHWIEEPV